MLEIWIVQYGLVVLFVVWISFQVCLSLAIIWSLQLAAYLWARTLAGVPHGNIACMLWPLPAKWRDRIGGTES